MEAPHARGVRRTRSPGGPRGRWRVRRRHPLGAGRCNDSLSCATEHGEPADVGCGTPRRAAQGCDVIMVEPASQFTGRPSAANNSARETGLARNACQSSSSPARGSGAGPTSGFSARPARAGELRQERRARPVCLHRDRGPSRPRIGRPRSSRARPRRRRRWRRRTGAGERGRGPCGRDRRRRRGGSVDEVGLNRPSEARSS